MFRSIPKSLLFLAFCPHPLSWENQTLQNKWWIKRGDLTHTSKINKGERGSETTRKYGARQRKLHILVICSASYCPVNLCFLLLCNGLGSWRSIHPTCFGHYYAHHQEFAAVMLITTLVVLFLVCFSLQPRHYSSLTAPNLQHTANQEQNDQCGNEYYSRELLMMGIVIPEICWAYKKYN